MLTEFFKHTDPLCSVIENAINSDSSIDITPNAAELVVLLRDLATMFDPNTDEPRKVSDALDALIAEAKAIQDELHNRVYQQVSNGESVSGFELTEGRVSRRIDEAAMVQTMRVPSGSPRTDETV